MIFLKCCHVCQRNKRINILVSRSDRICPVGCLFNILFLVLSPGEIEQIFSNFLRRQQVAGWTISWSLCSINHSEKLYSDSKSTTQRHQNPARELHLGKIDRVQCTVGTDSRPCLDDFIGSKRQRNRRAEPRMPQEFSETFCVEPKQSNSSNDVKFTCRKHFHDVQILIFWTVGRIQRFTTLCDQIAVKNGHCDRR